MIRRQAIICTNAGLLLIGPLGTNFSGIRIKIQPFSLKKNQFENIICNFAVIFSVLQCVNRLSDGLLYGEGASDVIRQPIERYCERLHPHFVWQQMDIQGFAAMGIGDKPLPVTMKTWMIR